MHRPISFLLRPFGVHVLYSVSVRVCTPLLFLLFVFTARFLRDNIPAGFLCKTGGATFVTRNYNILLLLFAHLYCNSRTRTIRGRTRPIRGGISYILVFRTFRHFWWITIIIIVVVTARAVSVYCFAQKLLTYIIGVDARISSTTYSFFDDAHNMYILYAQSVPYFPLYMCIINCNIFMYTRLNDKQMPVCTGSAPK